jgi:hypothetical protein
VAPRGNSRDQYLAAQQNARRQSRFLEHETTTRLIARVLGEFAGGPPFESYDDLKVALRRRLAQLRVRFGPADVDEAITQVETNRSLVAAPVTAVPSVSDEPSVGLTRTEAREVYERLCRRFRVVPVHRMRAGRLVPRGEAERLRALQIVLQAIVEQAARCDEVDRVE